MSQHSLGRQLGKTRDQRPLRSARIELGVSRPTPGRGNRFRRVHDAPAHLRAAFGGHPSSSIAALQLRMDPRSVKRCRAVIAAFLMYMQLLTVGILLFMSVAVRPDFVMSREA